MGFWIFMVCANLMMPLLMIIFGAVFLHWPPREINGFYGYRTAKSMKSQEAWDFAQMYFGKVWLRTGLIMLIPSVLAMLPCMGESDGKVGLWSLILCTVECVIMVLSILPIERALKRRFPER